MDLPVNVAVIGCGAAFEHLYRMPLLRLERKGWLKVIALAEPNPRRQELARSLFPSATVSAAVSDISQGISVGLTVITSPPPLHFEHARIAMEAGSHILCEKPPNLSSPNSEGIS